MVRPATRAAVEIDAGGERYLGAYTGAILLGAFLLFAVQPLIARFILPWFGGSPAVWTTCMLFFQTGLLAGYGYAHYSIRRWSPRTQAIVHGCLLLAALALLPITPSASWKPGPEVEPVGRILLLLLVCLGAPYLVLSATGPLLQAWFSRVNHGASPYRLFAVSNAGALLALLTYPVLVEPFVSRRAQAATWSGLLILFVGLCGYCAWRAARVEGDAAGSAPVEPTGGQSGVWHRLGWVLLPMLGCLLLLSITNQLSHEIGVVSLLWVFPLALYLVSFIVCFHRLEWYSRRLFGALFAVGVLAICSVWYQSLRLPLSLQFVVYAGTLFAGCMLCHGEVARIRPAPRELTAYYLLIALGGALGGVFVALVAPVVFTDFFELHLSLIGGCVLVMGLLVRDWARQKRSIGGMAGRTALLLGLSVLVVAIPLPAISSRAGRVDAARNFFGVIHVQRFRENNPLDEFFIMAHAGTTHGMQYVHPERRMWPTTYYGEHTGVGVTLRLMDRSEGRRVGVVGLGVGTLAAYGKHGDYFRFYEINPAVTDFAQRYFTYLRDTQAKWDIVPGDARISMEQEQPQRFDVLVLDAFTGHAVPVHLLTREAFQVYLRHLKPDGVLAVHVSNPHFELLPVLWRVGLELGLKTLPLLTPPVLEKGVGKAEWVMLTRNDEFLRQGGGKLALERIAAMDSSARQFPLWTDERVSVLQALK